ncbi:hypothetical protein B0T21DRAFT_346377 [Apiosordaria backusii]|uniref:Uncharacterized protein n=1 Tax=Apiosordaria backusii TaxID=314023 RepID=A0AA40EIN1_9PEZI|nr:hypothetical protein B0T21DRAFT_346377 [Apiosordaria backusii]
MAEVTSRYIGSKHQALHPTGPRHMSLPPKLSPSSFFDRYYSPNRKIEEAVDLFQDLSQTVDNNHQDLSAGFENLSLSVNGKINDLNGKTESLRASLVQQPQSVTPSRGYDVQLSRFLAIATHLVQPPARVTTLGTKKMGCTRLLYLPYRCPRCNLNAGPCPQEDYNWLCSREERDHPRQPYVPCFLRSTFDSCTCPFNTQGPVAVQSVEVRPENRRLCEDCQQGGPGGGEGETAASQGQSEGRQGGEGV